MFLIIGLGNPGEKFNNTPHNVGFAVIDKFAEKKTFPGFELNKKSESLTSEGTMGSEKIILTKPQTFMNESGKTAKKLQEQKKGQKIIVVHDDVDLQLGKIKIVVNRGSAGHKGVESIIKAIGNEDIIRIRIGVMPTTGKPKEAEKFVLKKFSKNESNTLNKIVDRATMAIEILVIGGLEKAMNECNR